MLEIASHGEWDLTQRLQKTLHGQVKFIDTTYNGPENQNPLFCNIRKIIHFIKAIRNRKYVMVYASPKMYPYVFLSKIMCKKVIVYWIGTDVYMLKNSPNSYLVKKGDINWAHSKSLHHELLELGIETDIISILPQGINLSMGSMPKEHAVLFYIPEGKEKFYGYDWITTLINRFPNLTFHIVANGKREMFPQNNAIVHGMISFEEMEKLYNEISIVLRFPEHDSLSISIMEAMFKAKIIIYRYKQEGTILATNIDEFEERLYEQIQKNPKPVIEAREYALENFSEKVVRKQFQEIVHKYHME